MKIRFSERCNPNDFYDAHNFYFPKLTELSFDKFINGVKWYGGEEIGFILSDGTEDG